jgi:uncharacterized protein with ParB-like and HNH nuclease domain
LDDIHESFSFSPESEYFLGSLVVCEGTVSNKKEVIDGQQRLITLSLLLNILKRKYKQNAADPSTIANLLYSTMITPTGETVNSNVIEIHYEGKDVLYDLYKYEDDDEINPKITEGLPGKTIFEAHRNILSFFDTNFSAKDSFAQIKKFAGYLLNKVKVIQIVTPEIGNALKIFETINERGISLDQVDLLKNLLFIQIKRSDFQKLVKEWEKFKQALVGRKVKEKPLRFLRYFIMANYDIDKDSSGESVVREDDIFNWFSKNEPKCNYKSNSFAFVRKLQEDADFYINLTKNRHYADDNMGLETLSHLVGSGFKQHFLLLLSAKKMDIELFNHFVRQLESLIFCYTITKEPSRVIEKRFSAWSEEIRKIKTKTDLNSFIVSRFKNEFDMRNRVFENNFKNLVTDQLQGYKLKYILAKLCMFIEQEKNGDQEVCSLAPYVKRSIHIEHILPYTSTPECIAEFGIANDKEYNIYKNKVGNLTLLEKPINTSIKQDIFQAKREEYKKSSLYLTRSICAIENVGQNTSINRTNKYLKSYDRWNREAIDNRTALLLEISKVIWQIKQLD